MDVKHIKYKKNIIYNIYVSWSPYHMCNVYNGYTSLKQCFPTQYIG